MFRAGLNAESYRIIEEAHTVVETELKDIPIKPPAEAVIVDGESEKESMGVLAELEVGGSRCRGLYR